MTNRFFLIVFAAVLLASCKEKRELARKYETKETKRAEKVILSGTCPETREIRYERIPGKKDDTVRHIIRENLVTPEGIKILPGKYLVFNVTKNGVTKEYVTSPNIQERKCSTLEEGADIISGQGLIVQPDGIHFTGTGDLDLFVESPVGSGYYIIKIPHSYKKK